MLRLNKMTSGQVEKYINKKRDQNVIIQHFQKEMHKGE